MTPGCRLLTLSGRTSHSLTPLISTAALLKSLFFFQLLTDFLESALEILCVFGHGSFALHASSALTVRIRVGVRVRVSALLVETLPRD